MHALQEYTVTHYPEMPSKFGELLLRMPELSRVCQVRKHLQTFITYILSISVFSDMSKIFRDASLIFRFEELLDNVV